MVDEYLKNIRDLFTMYKLIGLYQPSGVHIGHKLYGYFTRFFGIELVFFLQCLCFSRIKNIIDFADLTSMFFTYLSSALKSYILISKFDELERLITRLRKLLELASFNQINFGDHIKRRMTSIRKVFILFWGTCLFSITMAFITTLLAAKEPPYIPHYRIYSPWFFNFEQEYVYFVIVEVWEFIGPFIPSATTVYVDFLGVFFFSMGAGLLEELAERVKLIETDFVAKFGMKIGKENQEKFEYIKQRHDEKTVQELKRCIEIHSKIKEFLVDAQALVSPLSFVQIMISTLVVCMTSYTISMFSPLSSPSEFFRQITYMIPMGLQIFIPCFYGNEIMIAAEKFSMDMFHTKWYFGSKKFQKNFSILFVHATQPLVMVCGAIFRVTLENFVTVAQLTYKFYTVMQNQNAKLANGVSEGK